MAEVKFKRGTALELETMPVIDGQLLYNTETGETFMDVGSERKATGSFNGEKTSGTWTLISDTSITDEPNLSISNLGLRAIKVLFDGTEAETQESGTVNIQTKDDKTINELYFHTNMSTKKTFVFGSIPIFGFYFNYQTGSVDTNGEILPFMHGWTRYINTVSTEKLIDKIVFNYPLKRGTKVLIWGVK